MGTPVTVTEYSEAATFATTKDADKAPLETEHVYVFTAPLVTSQLVSDEEKPEPVMSTVAPAAADDAPNVMVGEDPAEIVKLLDAESPAGLPATVIVYVPSLAEATTKLPVRVPADTVQV